MKTKITLAILALTVVVVLPPTAEAQRAGFVVGLGPGAVHQSISPHLVGPVVQPFVTAPPFGVVIPPRHHVPRGQVIQQGQVIFIGPPTVKYGPGVNRSVGPIVAPYVSVVTPRGSGVFPRRRRGRFGGTRIGSTWSAERGRQSSRKGHPQRGHHHRPATRGRAPAFRTSQRHGLQRPGRDVDFRSHHHHHPEWRRGLRAVRSASVGSVRAWSNTARNSRAPGFDVSRIGATGADPSRALVIAAPAS